MHTAGGIECTFVNMFTRLAMVAVARLSTWLNQPPLKIFASAPNQLMITEQGQMAVIKTVVNV